MPAILVRLARRAVRVRAEPPHRCVAARPRPVPAWAADGPERITSAPVTQVQSVRQLAIKHAAVMPRAGMPMQHAVIIPVIHTARRNIMAGRVMRAARVLCLVLHVTAVIPKAAVRALAQPRAPASAHPHRPVVHPHAVPQTAVVHAPQIPAARQYTGFIPVPVVRPPVRRAVGFAKPAAVPAADAPGMFPVTVGIITAVVLVTHVPAYLGRTAAPITIMITVQTPAVTLKTLPAVRARAASRATSPAVVHATCRAHVPARVVPVEPAVLVLAPVPVAVHGLMDRGGLGLHGRTAIGRMANGCIPATVGIITAVVLVTHVPAYLGRTAAPITIMITVQTPAVTLKTLPAVRARAASRATSPAVVHATCRAHVPARVVPVEPAVLVLAPVPVAVHGLMDRGGLGLHGRTAIGRMANGCIPATVGIITPAAVAHCAKADIIARAARDTDAQQQQHLPYTIITVPPFGAVRPVLHPQRSVIWILLLRTTGRLNLNTADFIARPANAIIPHQPRCIIIVKTRRIFPNATQDFL